VVKEFRLVGGNVHVNLTVGAAALAGQAKIQRFADGALSPAMHQRISLKHLEE
jgi:hypothetical protein